MPKITALTAGTALTDDDLLVTVDDPAGTPTAKKITAANAKSYFRQHVGARVYRSTTQSVSNTTLTSMSFDTARWQDNGTFWIVGSPTRLTVPVAGTYLFGHCFEIDQPLNDARTVYADLFLNGTTIITEHSGSGFRTTGNTGDTIVLTAAVAWKCSANDYVEARIYQNSGSPCTVSAGTATLANGNDAYAELIAV